MAAARLALCVLVTALISRDCGLWWLGALKTQLAFVVADRAAQLQRLQEVLALRKPQFILQANQLVHHAA